MVQPTVIAGFEVFLPTDDEARAGVQPAPRLDTFHGKRIGFLSNTKDNVDHLFAGIHAQLAAHYSLQCVVQRAKAHFAVRAPQALLEALHQDCDAVIVAAGA